MNHNEAVLRLLVARDPAALIEYTKVNPDAVVAYDQDGKTPWIVTCVELNILELVKAALDVGFPIDALRLPERWHALSTAINRNRLDLVELLLNYGANCNLDRCILTAIIAGNADFALSALKLLLAHGLQLNRVFTMYDEPGTEFTALDRVEEDSPVYLFLRKHGAKHYAELT